MPRNAALGGVVARSRKTPPAEPPKAEARTVLVPDVLAPSPRRRARRGARDKGSEVDAQRAEESEAEGASDPIEPSGSVDAAAKLPLEELEAEEALDEADRAELALSPLDPLSRYMHEVQRHPVLSREEEHTLAVVLRESGDVNAAYKLVASNLRLVVKIAYEYRRAAFNVLDLIQEGNVGLMHAVRKYDPYKGVKLSSYAAWWIRAYILRFIMDNWRMVKLGTTQAQRKLFFNLRKEQQRLAAEGYSSEPKLLAERLQVTEQEIVDMDRRLSGDESSIDTPVSDEGGSTLGDRLQQHAQPADEALGDLQMRAMLREHLHGFAAKLEGKERYIFEQRLLTEEPMTLQDIGTHFGISRERARQLEARLIQKLRKELREKLPDFAELTVEGDD